MTIGKVFILIFRQINLSILPAFFFSTSLDAQFTTATVPPLMLYSSFLHTVLTRISLSFPLYIVFDRSPLLWQSSRIPLNVWQIAALQAVDNTLHVRQIAALQAVNIPYNLDLIFSHLTSLRMLYSRPPTSFHPTLIYSILEISILFLPSFWIFNESR